ncbi:MAG: FAD-dependent oxidoreductase [Betaproteobacteria bacterium]|nr:FAD-dependent oxidoreductase [Betaproteobacteria bacterium]
MVQAGDATRTAADVVVVGGGGAGLAAASAAAELGRHVILLEKNPDLGGSTAWSVGSVSATCTPHQIGKGIKDCPEHHLEDLMRFSGELVHRDNLSLARVLTENTSAMFRWLLAMGLVFVGPFPEPPHRQPRMHNVLPNSKAFPYLLGRHCRGLGVDIRLNVRADQLIADAGRITGVAATLPDGRRHDFIAQGGVVLAGGDFSASRELKAKYASEEVAAVDAVNPTSTGDGIRMALERGAVVVNGDHLRGPIMRFVPPLRPKLIQRLPPLHPLTLAMRWSFDHLPAWLLRPFLMSFLTTALAPSHDLFRHGAILVDMDGVRFADERNRPDRAAAKRRGGMAFIVFDKLVADQFSSWPNFISTAPAVGYAYLDDYRRTRRDIFHRAGTLAELAARMDVPRDGFEKTVADYNAGKEVHGASVRGTRPAVAVPPFYALGPAKAYIIFTNGGLKVTERLEVVNAAGAVIPGLYAAGSNGQGGMLLEGHGHHLGWAFVSGRIAGRHAALSARKASLIG